MSLAPLAAIFVASLAGSLHCAGMCGPLAAAACSGPVARATSLTVGGRALLPARSEISSMAAYHAGRALGYAALGAAAGMLGSVVNIAGNLAGLQHAALLLTSVSLIGLGVAKLVRSRAPRASKGAAPWHASLWRRATAWNPIARAAAIGLLTSLLPCGWLWAFVLAAAGAGSAVGGVAVMGAFFLGSVPALTLAGGVLSRAVAPALAKVPAAAGLFIIAAGIYLLTVRLPVIVDRDRAEPGVCHAP